MKMRQVRNLIYLIYLTIILLSVILALINLPQVSQTQKGVPLGDRFDSGQRQFFSPNLEEIPADGKPFNWMEHLRYAQVRNNKNELVFQRGEVWLIGVSVLKDGQKIY